MTRCKHEWASLIDVMGSMAFDDIEWCELCGSLRNSVPKMVAQPNGAIVFKGYKYIYKKPKMPVDTTDGEKERT